MFWTQNKDYLYVALYARGGPPKMPGLEDTFVPRAFKLNPPVPNPWILRFFRYHWALLAGPRQEGNDSHGRRFHVKEAIEMLEDGSAESIWEYSGKQTRMAPTNMLLVRIVVGKIKDHARLESIFENIPLRNLEDPTWNCVEWVKEALQTATSDRRAVGTCIKDWSLIRSKAMEYVASKKAVGRFSRPETYDPKKAPTWDMLQNMELAA